MRRTVFEMNRDDTIALFARAHAVTVATVDPEGMPHVRTLHGVLVGDSLCFHGTPKGARASMIGWPTVVSADEVVAGAPSYFVDAQRACPATTYYVSAQARGVLRTIEDPVQKARVLEALMQRFQPEGGYAPITAEDPMYTGPIAGIAVQAIRLDAVSGKAKLAQNRRPDDLRRLLENLWSRGEQDDPAAIEALLSANHGADRPAFLRGPEDLRLHVCLGADDLESAVDLVSGTYWNEGVSAETLRRAHLGSNAWIGAKDPSGALVATARAISDGGKHGWIYDVAVAPHLRRRGIATALLTLLLAHPALRRTAQIHLQTRDAQSLYRRCGFREIEPDALTPRMTLARPGALAAGGDPLPLDVRPPASPEQGHEHEHEPEG